MWMRSRLTCPRLPTKSSTSRACGPSTLEVASTGSPTTPWMTPRSTVGCTCGDDLASNDWAASLPMPACSRAIRGSRADNSTMCGVPDGASFGAVLSRLPGSGALICRDCCVGLVRIGNAHLILIERKIGPPTRATLRQCSSRRGKQSLRQWRRKLGLLRMWRARTRRRGHRIRRFPSQSNSVAL